MSLRSGLPKLFADDAAYSNADECILWPYDKSSSGHGAIYIDNKRVPAHSYVLEKSGKVKPDKSLICLHDPSICNNPSCVNPRHLRWGTHKDNVEDKSIAGTQVNGSQNYNAKLNDYTVVYIRELYRNGKGTIKQLSEKFSASPNTIRSCVRGKTWKHLPGATDESPYQNNKGRYKR